MNNRFFSFTKIALLALFLISPKLLANDSFIKPYHTTYASSYKFLLPFKGKATRELVQESNGSWLLKHQVTSPMIKVVESSHFSWDNIQATPLNYQYLQSGLTKKRQVSLEFDWTDGVVTNTALDEPLSIKLVPNALDKLSYQIQLRRDLLGPNKPSVYSYDVVSRKRVKQYKFELLGEEQIETPIGKLNTLKLKRLRKEGSKRETTIWLAKDWDYLLAQIHQKENGKSYEIVISEGDLAGKPITGLPE